jgi:hypothetical protein
MDLVARINTLLWTWIQSLRSAKRISLFFPFLLFALLQSGLLLLLLSFHLRPISGLLIPLIRWLSQEAALHYPQFYFFLPGLFSKMNGWLLNPIIGWLFVGAATLMFAGWYRGRPVATGSALGGALRRIVPLFAVGLVEWLVVRVVMRLFGLLSTSVWHWGTQSPRMLMLVGFFVNIIFIVPFAYTSAEVVLAERGIVGSLRRSFGLARRNFGLTYILFAIPSLLTLAMNIILRDAPIIVTRSSPNMIVVLLSINIFITLGVNFLIVGGLTALYLRATETLA